MRVVTMLHLAQRHQYSTGYNFLCHNDASSVFNRIGKDKFPKLFVFERLKRDSQAKPSIFTRIARGKKPSGSQPAEIESSVFNRLGESNKVQRFIPSHMKRVSTLDVKIDGSLKVKRCTLVITSCDCSSNSKDEIKDEDQVSSNHITIWGRLMIWR